MGKGRSPWQDGRRAWERLNGWHQDRASAAPGHPDDGDAALDALADVGTVRRLLEQAELGAVRTARRHRKSWAEIATRLGVTRQSAWERWHELDGSTSADVEPAPSASSTQTVDSEQELTAVAQAAVAAVAAGAQRRRSTVRVPNVVGLAWDDARSVLLAVGLVAVGPDPDGAPLAALGWPNGVVTDQSPESGAKVPSGAPVTVWLSRGDGSGGAGVREPRRPTPTPRAGRVMRDVVGDEAVG